MRRMLRRCGSESLTCTDCRMSRPAQPSRVAGRECGGYCQVEVSRLPQLQSILEDDLAIRITLRLMEGETRFVGKLEIALIVGPRVYRPRVPGEPAERAGVQFIRTLSPINEI